MIYEMLRETVRNDLLMEADIARFINPGDDYSCYNVYIGEAAPIACLRKSGRAYRDPYAIAAPGAPVYQADKKDLARVYDIAPGKGREKIGTLLREKNVNVCLDLKQLLQSQVHLAVVGRTGAGKSWFVQHMLERLPMRCVVFPQRMNMTRCAWTMRHGGKTTSYCPLISIPPNEFST